MNNIIFSFKENWTISCEISDLRFQPPLHIENVPLCDIASLGSICQSVEKKLNFLAETLLFWSSKSVSSFLSSWSCSSSVNQTLHSTPVEQQDGSHLSYSKTRVDECVVIFQYILRLGQVMYFWLQGLVHVVKRIALSLYPGLMRSWTLHSTPVEQQDGSHLSYSKSRGDEFVVTFQLNTCQVFKFLICVHIFDLKP